MRAFQSSHGDWLSHALAGVAVGPFVFGVLAEHVSYSAAWNVAAASAVLAAACIAVGNRMSPTPQTATVLLHERNN